MNIFFVKGRSKEFDSFVSLKELGFALGLQPFEGLDKDVCVESVERLVHSIGAFSQLEKSAHGTAVHAGRPHPPIDQVRPFFRRPPVDVSATFATLFGIHPLQVALRFQVVPDSLQKVGSGASFDVVVDEKVTRVGQLANVDRR